MDKAIPGIDTAARSSRHRELYRATYDQVLQWRRFQVSRTAMVDTRFFHNRGSNADNNFVKQQPEFSWGLEASTQWLLEAKEAYVNIYVLTGGAV